MNQEIETKRKSIKKIAYGLLSLGAVVTTMFVVAGCIGSTVLTGIGVATALFVGTPLALRIDDLSKEIDQIKMDAKPKDEES